MSVSAVTGCAYNTGTLSKLKVNGEAISTGLKDGGITWIR